MLSKEWIYYQDEVRTVMFSLLLNLGTNGFTCLPNHGSGQSDFIKVLSIRAEGSNPGLLGGDPTPYLSAYHNHTYDLFSVSEVLFHCEMHD